MAGSSGGCRALESAQGRVSDGGWIPEARGGLACTEGDGVFLVERSWPSNPTIWETSLLDACKSNSLLLFCCIELELLFVTDLFRLL